jgi:cation transporter-like permease
MRPVIALSVARWTLLACVALWAIALAVALLGGPIGPAYLVAQCAILGIALSALATLVLQAVRFFRYRRDGGHA